MDKKTLESVFRTYDIRGLFPSELDENFFENLGKAYVTKYHPTKVVVGHDMRPSSLDLKNALVQGLLKMGCSVVDVGEVAAEMVFFAVGEYSNEFDGGFYITASHNQADWNGCKIVGKNVRFVSLFNGLEDLKNIILNDSYEDISKDKGDYQKIDIYPEYKKKILSFITTDKRKPLKIVMDAGNGMGGKVFDYVFGDLDCLDVEKLYFKPDGNFPNHVPNPMEEENVIELKKKVIETGADFGIATDGDGDRAFFIDKKGRKPNGTYLGVLLAKHLTSGNKENKNIVTDSRIVFPFSKEQEKIGMKVFQSKSGRSYIRKKIEEENAILGVEASSHFFYKDFYWADSGMLTIAYMLDMYFEGFDLTREVDYLFEKYPNSGEVNFILNDPTSVMSRIEDNYARQGAKIEKNDGITVEFPDWRLNIRESNTQPLVRLNVEGINKEIVIEKFSEVEKMIGVVRDNAPALEELRNNPQISVKS